MTKLQQQSVAAYRWVALASGNFPATSAMGGRMYEAPVLERYGTFRELTKGGFADIDDGFTANANDSCKLESGAGPDGTDVITCLRSN
jgi:hypothetical protein